MAVYFGIRGYWEDLIEMGIESGCLIKSMTIDESNYSERIINILKQNISYDEMCSLCHSEPRIYPTLCHSCISLS